jgi:hypothetical protein
VNEQIIGGIGFGPSGGAPGNPSESVPEAGFVGSYGGPPDLLPLMGGSGGGGGSTFLSSTSTLCGGGGGGGGAILFAANGTLRVDGTIDASGGMGGNYGGASSGARPGGSGSGGAIRLLATTVEGSGRLLARGGPSPTLGRGIGGTGRIRIEALQNTLPPSASEPVAFLGAAPGPLESPLDPRVAIAEVGGAAVARPPRGFGVALGTVDVVVPAPGRVPVAVETRFVPGGTQVAVTVKPRLGVLLPFATEATLGDCTADGTCRATANFDLAPGDYLIEAEATFAVP